MENTVTMSRALFLVLFLLFSLAFFPKNHSPLYAAEDEDDEEVKSTIPSDPEYRGRRRSAPSAPPPAAAPSAPAPSGGTEEDEWRTMRSERRRAYLPAVKVDDEKKRIFTGKIGFKSNSDSPTAESSRILKQLAAELNKRPELTVRIEGHSDSVGSDQANLEVSQRRADRVKEILVQNGVAAERLEAVGMGDKQSIASSLTPAGQEKNRRVEFHIAGAASPPAAAEPLPPPAAPEPPLIPVAPPPAAPLPAAPPAPPAPPVAPSPAPAPVSPPMAAPPPPPPPPPPVAPPLPPAQPLAPVPPPATQPVTP